MITTIGQAVTWCAEHEAKADFFTVRDVGNRVQVSVRDEYVLRNNLVDAVNALAELLHVAEDAEHRKRQAEADLAAAREKAQAES